MELKDQNTAVMTVVGRDAVGIIARISTLLYQNNVNINDITQTILNDIFTMIMIVDLSASDANVDIQSLSEKLDTIGQEIGVSIRLQRTDLFNAMHRI
jgi:ACT domain-containing protein